MNEDTITLKAVRTDKGFNRSALHHFNFAEEKIDEKKGAVPDCTKPAYNRALAKSIVKILSEKWDVCDKSRSKPNKDSPAREIVISNAIKPGDIAILCKTNNEVNEIAEELHNFGIKVSSESYSLKETAEYFLISSLLKLLLSEQNVLAKSEIKVLTESNYSVSELIDDRLKFIIDLPSQPAEPGKDQFSGEDFEALYEKFLAEKKEYYKQLNSWGCENFLVNGLSKIIRELKEMPVPQLLEHLIIRLNIYGLVTSWGNTEQRQNNVQKIIEYAHKYDERCINMNLGSSPSGFLFYLNSQDCLTESRSGTSDAVNVMTYHKAKGLEWPLVVLANLHKDVDWGFVARNVFGVFVEDKNVVYLNDILSGRNIISLPWIFGTENSKVSDDIEGTDAYKLAKIKHENELKRIMYVGMTRPRDYLVTTGISGQKNYPWMTILNKHDNWAFEAAADVESGEVDIFNRGINFQVHKLRLSDDERIITKDVNKYFSGKKINPDRSVTPYFTSPSKVESTDAVQVYEPIHVQNRIPAGLSSKDKVDVLGNCLHDILYLYIGKKLNGNVDNCLEEMNRIIKNYKMDAIISPEDVLNSAETLFEFLNLKFNPIRWHRELPLECEIGGQLYKGEADLVLDTKEGYILIDYKSYPGSIERVLDASSAISAKSNYAGKYAGQLKTYQKMIEELKDKKVINKFIYYTVLGQLIELK